MYNYYIGQYMILSMYNVWFKNYEKKFPVGTIDYERHMILVSKISFKISKTTDSDMHSPKYVEKYSVMHFQILSTNTRFIFHLPKKQVQYVPVHVV